MRRYISVPAFVVGLLVFGLLSVAYAQQITGTPNNDVITGTDNKDTIEARGGADTVYASKGNDDVEGEQGYDNLNGQGGDDFLKGNSGDDDLGTGDGSNWLNGLDNDDMLIGNATTSANNVLGGDLGSDFIDARNGDADFLIDGGGGSDVCLVDNADINAGVVYHCEQINP